MLAAPSKPLPKHDSRRGFTIVELLIVIVVIGILAAITIVAYNGVQTRAHATQAQSDAESLAKLLAIANISNGFFPVDLSTVNNGQSMPAANGTSYLYHSDSSRSSYCATVTDATSSYKITDIATTPQVGGCMGDAVGGVPLATNLAPNPSFETDTTSWNAINIASGTTMTRVVSGTGILAGWAALEVMATTANQSGAQIVINGLLGSTTYTVSAYMTLMSGDVTNLGLRAGSACGTQASSNIGGSLIVDQPVRVSLTWTNCASPGTVAVQFWRNGVAPAQVVFRLDAVMIEQGSSATTYSN